MNFQYIGQMKQKLVYCCSEGYFVSQEYENIRKATRKEKRQIGKIRETGELHNPKIEGGFGHWILC